MTCPITWIPWIMRVMNEAGVVSGGIVDDAVNREMYRLFQDGTPIAVAAADLRRLTPRRWLRNA